METWKTRGFVPSHSCDDEKTHAEVDGPKNGAISHHSDYPLPSFFENRDGDYGHLRRS